MPEIGLLWQHYGEKYNHVEQHSPIEPVIERFGVLNTSPPYATVQLLSGAPPLPRVWFLTEDKTELLQIQQDRFLRNWRQVNKDDVYPRYLEHIRPSFIKDFVDFQEFLKTNNIGEVKVNQCEVTYINHIYQEGKWDSHADIGNIFKFWEVDFKSKYHREIEEARFQFRCVLRDDKDDFLGRIHVNAQPAFRKSDDAPIFVLNITARGRPLAPDDDGVLGFFDIGRENIVNLFTDITSDELHNDWGRTDQI